MKTLDQKLIYSEALRTSSNATVMSKPYDVSNCDRLTFVLSMGTAIPSLSPAIRVLQSGDPSMSTNTNLGGTTLSLSAGTSHVISNARSAVISFSSGTTTGDDVTVNGNVFAFSVTPASSLYTYGTTRQSSNADGRADISNQFSSRINENSSRGLVATTISTAAVKIWVADGQTTMLNITGSTNASPSIDSAQGYISVRPGDLDSTSRYVCLAISSLATTVDVAVTVIKDGCRYTPFWQGISTVSS